jgi:hypothetical protein
VLTQLQLSTNPTPTTPTPNPSTHANMASTIPVTQITKADLDATQITIEAAYSKKEVQVYVRPVLEDLVLVSQPNSYSIHPRLLG